MRNGAVGAILDAAVGVAIVAAAIIQSIQRAIAEKTIEILGIIDLVTRKPFARRVTEK